MTTKTNTGFRLEAKKDNSLELDIYDVIGDGWFGGVSAKAVADALKPYKDAESITVNLNSPGGDAFDGISIYNILNRHKARVTVNIDGLAASAASVIAMAGDEINMADNAMLMIHDAWTIGVGDSKELTKTADRLEKLDDQIANTYAKRTGGDFAAIKEQMDEETWFNADEALADGFITSITESKRVAACFDARIFNNFARTPEGVKEAFTNPAAVEPVENLNQKDKLMSDVTPETFASANPDAVANWKAEAAVDADKANKERAEAIKAAFPNDPAFALDQIIAGHDVPKAKAEYADVLAAQNEQLRAENADLKKKSDDDGAEPIELHAGELPKDKYEGLSPNEKARAQWDDNHNKCQDKFKTLSAYCAYVISMSKHTS